MAAARRKRQTTHKKHSLELAFLAEPWYPKALNPGSNPKPLCLQSLRKTQRDGLKVRGWHVIAEPATKPHAKAQEAMPLPSPVLSSSLSTSTPYSETGPNNPQALSAQQALAPGLHFESQTGTHLRRLARLAGRPWDVESVNGQWRS